VSKIIAKARRRPFLDDAFNFRLHALAAFAGNQIAVTDGIGKPVKELPVGLQLGPIDRVSGNQNALQPVVRRVRAVGDRAKIALQRTQPGGANRLDQRGLDAKITAVFGDPGDRRL